MAGAKKRTSQSSIGGWPRPQAESRRQRFLYTDVTPAEDEKIRQYCEEKEISVSQFLADLMLRDALKPKARSKEKVVLRIELELTPQQLDRLELLTRLHEKDSITQLVHEIIEPHLSVQRLHVPSATTTLRYYLSDEEYARVMQHLATLGVSARNYAAVLALRAIAKHRRRALSNIDSPAEMDDAQPARIDPLAEE